MSVPVVRCGVQWTSGEDAHALTMTAVYGHVMDPLQQEINQLEDELIEAKMVIKSLRRENIDLKKMIRSDTAGVITPIE